MVDVKVVDERERERERGQAGNGVDPARWQWKVAVKSAEAAVHSKC